MDLTNEARTLLSQEMVLRGLIDAFWLNDGSAEPATEIEGEGVDEAPGMAVSEEQIDVIESLVLDFDETQVFARSASKSDIQHVRTSDDDSLPRSTDGVDVAQRLLDAAIGPLYLPAYPFVEAVLLAVRSGSKVRTFADRRRRKVVDLCTAVVDGDFDRALDIGRDEWIQPIRNALLGHKIPDRLLADDPSLWVALVQTQNKDLLGACIKTMAEDPDLHHDDLICYALLAMDRGIDASPLLERWRDPDTVDDSDEAQTWRAAEVRRLARLDLDAALELEAELPHDREAATAVAARLARVDSNAAFEHVMTLGPDFYHVGWFDGCIAGEIPQAGELIDAWTSGFLLMMRTFTPRPFLRRASNGET